jgi:hypothetical protein
VIAVRIAAALIVLSLACVQPQSVVVTPAADVQASRAPVSAATASPTAAASPRLLTFSTEHHYLDFTYVPGHLIFSGGPADDVTSSPDLIDRDIDVGRERVVSSALDRSASILAPAAAGDWIVFVETYQKGPLVYRVRAIGPGKDITLAQARYDTDSDQQRQRSLPIPMVATNGTVIAWTEPAGPRPGPRWALRGFDTRTGQQRELFTGDLPLSFPTFSGSDLVVGEGDEHPHLLGLRPFEDTAARPLLPDTDVSEASAFGGNLAAKKGGKNVLDPAGIILIDRTTAKAELIVAESELAWAPSVNDRYVVWQGGARGKILAYDLRARAAVTIYEETPAGRPAAYGGALVWLALRPEDVGNPGSAVPQFKVLRWE